MKITILLFATAFFLAVSCKNSAQTEPQKPLTIEELSLQIEQNPERVDLLQKRAELYTQKADLNKAIVDLQQAVILAPDSTSYYLQLADLFMRIGKLSNTMDMLKKVTEIDPENEEAWLKVGEIYLMYKKYQEVFNFANKALEANPYSDKAFFLKAYAAGESGDTNTAINNYQQCLKHNPQHYIANNYLGIIYMNRKDELAVTYFENAIAIDSTTVDAYYNLGMYYQTSDMLNEAIATYKRIEEVDSSFPNSYYNIGYIYLELLGIADQGATYFTKAIEANPNYIEAYYNRGLCFEELGDVITAKKDYKAALAINPDYESAIMGLNRVEEALRR